MKKFIGSIKNRKGNEERSPSVSNGHTVTSGPMVPPQGDSPEAVVVRELIAFCESGAPNSNSGGEEYLHLPAIVDGAESSPTAAKEAALCVKRYLSKEHYQRGFAQYNAIMLTRILTDNPGRNFTQNFDKDFIATIKKMLRDSQDSSVQQILRETLDYFEAEKLASNDTLLPLLEMWRKEKGSAAKLTVYPRVPVGGLYQRPPQSQPRGLPPPGELAGRIEEAKTTARLLVQTVQSTPVNELASNELVVEFAGRAKSAQKSIANYMNCENPRPDDDTMLTLIETNEQLNIAISRHQRALLQARKTGATPSPQPQPESNSYVAAGQPVYGQVPERQNLSPPPTSNTNFGRTSPNVNGQFVPPPGPPPGARGAVRNSQPPPPTTKTNDYQAQENPFTDDASYEQTQPSYSLFGKSNNPAPSQQQYYAYNSSQPTRQYAEQPQSGNAYNTAPTRNYTEPSQVSNPYSSPPTRAYPETQAYNTTSSPPPPPQLRPGGYERPTASYMHRQESAANNITMHGASPPQEPLR